MFPSKGNNAQARIFLVAFGLVRKPLPQGVADGASGGVSWCEHPSSHEPCSLRKGTTHKPESFLLPLASCTSPFLKGLRTVRAGGVSLCEHPSSHEPCSLRKGTTHKPETFLLRLASCASPFLKGLRMARAGMSAGVNIPPRASRVPFEREQRTSQKLYFLRLGRGLVRKPLPQGAADGASGDVSWCEHPSSR